MGRPSVSRNAPCRCGSGRKHTRCCLADEDRAAREARFDDAVGRRIQDWSSSLFDDEITAALEEYVGPERVMDDGDIQIFATWFHNDRELAVGRTPAERYAARPDLPDAERDAAARIATARLGLYRVLAVEPGRSLAVEELVGGRRVDVQSPHVSREAIRWDILLSRVMDGDPPSREQALVATFRRHALPLMRFLPPSRTAEPSFFTLEGDPVVLGSAVVGVRSRRCRRADARARRPRAGRSGRDGHHREGRAALVRGRPPLPPGALVLESSPVGAIDAIPIATLRLEGGELQGEAMSEQRLAQMLEVVAADFGELVELRSREVMSVDEALAARGAGRRDSAPERLGGAGASARWRLPERAYAAMAGRAAPVSRRAHAARSGRR